MLYGLILLQSTITLGPAALSYPELAQALTKAGMPCAVSPVLSERGAYVRLKVRSPESTRRILGEALGVAFRQEERGWRMVVDPEAKERERRFLLHYRRQAVEVAQAWTKEQDRFRAGRSYEMFDRWVKAETEALADETEATPKAVERLKTAFRGAQTLCPSVWCAPQAVRNGAVGQVLERPVEQSLALESALRLYGLPLAAVRGPSDNPRNLPYALATRLDFEPSGGWMTSDTEGVYSPDQLWRSRMNLPGYPWQGRMAGVTFHSVWEAFPARLKIEGKTLTETFERMGSEDAAFLSAFEPASSLPDEPRATHEGTRTLSSVLERLDLEGAMELSVRFEGIPLGRSLERVSLRDLLDVGPAVLPARGGLAPSWATEMNANVNENVTREARERGFPWRIRSRDGAWLVINPMAFLDRARWISPVPYLRVERVLAGLPKDVSRSSEGDLVPTWEVLTRIVRAAAPVGPESLGGYRGVRIGAFGSLGRLVRELDRWSQADRVFLWSALRRERNVTIDRPDGRLQVQRDVGDATVPAGTALLTVTWQGAENWSAFGSLDPKGLLD